MLSKLKKKTKKIEFKAYVNGIQCPITEVPDEIFSKKLMGDGTAIIAQGNLLCAPCEGEVILIAPTKHAIAIQTKDNVQLLLHIGLDSAEHKDSSFDVHVAHGDHVKEGQLLISISDECLSAVDQLFIPMVIVENPNGKKMSFDNSIEKMIAGESIIATYE